MLTIVPPLFLCGMKVPRKSDPDFSSDREVSIVCNDGGVFCASISEADAKSGS